MKILNVVFALVIGTLLQNCSNIFGPESPNKWVKGRQFITPDDSKVPDSMRALFKEDASILALRDVQSDPESKETLIILPSELVKYYYQGLIYLYDTSSLRSRDSVIDIYNIHASPNPSPHDFYLDIDSTKDWARAWREGNTLTGNQQIDDLMQKYNLQISQYYDFSWEHSVTLFSSEPINTSALAKKFELIEGVLHSAAVGYFGGPHDITATIKTNYLLLKFYVGWGDCPSGCIARHYWEFQISFYGGVKLIKSYGNPLPEDIYRF